MQRRLGYSIAVVMAMIVPTLAIIAPPASAIRTVSSLSVGGFHSCVIDTTGAAYCWGRNDSGQLGNGGVANQLTPTAVIGNHTWLQISAGLEGTCGIITGGQAYC